MKTRSLLFTLALTFISLAAFPQKGFKNIIVDQAWMQKHQDDKNLVVLHVGNEAGYTQGHIEKAQLIGASDFTVVTGNLYWELPEADAFAATLRSFGVDNKSRIIIVHGNDDHAAGFRLYFTLDYFGLGKQTRILDGGMKGWRANNLVSVTEAYKAEATPAGSLILKPDASIKVDKEYVNTVSLKDEINVIDARRAVYYEGAEEDPDGYKRSGHIPGAENICWLDIVDENLFMKDMDTLKAFYEQAGVKKKEEVVAYCHVGLRASVIYTVAKGLGYKVRLYDGSYNEWDTLSEEYPVKTGKQSY